MGEAYRTVRQYILCTVQRWFGGLVYMYGNQFHCQCLYETSIHPPSPPIFLSSVLATQPSASMSPLNPANLTSWSADDVAQWLVEQGLGQFVEVFQENLVDGECLMVLDNSLLKEDLGITALGHRSRILKRVKELKASFEPAS